MITNKLFFIPYLIGNSVYMLNVPITVLSFKIVIKLPVHLFPHPLNVLTIFYLMILPPGTLQIIIVRSRNKPSGFLEWRGKQSC